MAANPVKGMVEVDFKIIDTEIKDYNSNYEDMMPSMIAVVVAAEIGGETYWIDYHCQTSETGNIGARSSKLVVYENDEWERLRNSIDNDDEFFKLLDDIAIKAEVSAKWHEYIAQNYEPDDGSWSGLGADGEINKTKPQHGGARPGAGRKPIGGEIRKPRAIRLSDAEYELVKKYIESIRK